MCDAGRKTLKLYLGYLQNGLRLPHSNGCSQNDASLNILRAATQDISCRLDVYFMSDWPLWTIIERTGPGHSFYLKRKVSYIAEQYAIEE